LRAIALSAAALSAVAFSPSAFSSAIAAAITLGVGRRHQNRKLAR